MKARVKFRKEFKALVHKALRSPVDPNTNLYRVTNLESCQSGRTKRLEYEAVTDEYLQNKNSKVPFIFIHGADYQSPNQVTEELILPFLQGSKLNGLDTDGDLGNVDLMFFAWNSMFVCSEKHSYLDEALRKLSCFGRILLTFSYWRIFHKRLEIRAEKAGRQLDHYLDRIHESCPSWTRPIVVTHSLGARVWASIIQRRAEENRLPKRLASWWNVQPALGRWEFDPGSKFDLVPGAYADRGEKIQLWYSRGDILLGFFFLTLRRTLAMGQTGVKHALVNCVDITWLAGTSHGAWSLSKRHEHLMHRIGSLIQSRLSQVMICREDSSFLEQKTGLGSIP